MLVVTQVNWHGVLDERAQHLIDELGYEDWGSTLRLVDALHRNDLEGVEAFLDRATFDLPWAREVRAQAIVRLYGIGQAKALYRSLLEELTNERPDHQSAADVALTLRDTDAARWYIDQGLAARTMAGPRATFTNAMLELVAGRDGALEALREQISTTVSPNLIREWACRYLPVWTQAWGEDPRVAEALGTLQGEADARISTVPTLPSLIGEIDEAGVTSTDPALDKVVRTLLSAEDEGGVTDPAAIDGLRRLAVDSTLQPNLAAVLIATPQS